MSQLKRHREAMSLPKSGFELSLVSMLNGLDWYAQAHHRAYGTTIGCDPMIGEAWANSLRGVSDLLSGQLGRLDGGMLSRRIHDLAELNEVEL